MLDGHMMIDREMGLAVVAEQVTPVVPSITVDVVYAATERAYISAVVLNLDDKINGGLLRWKPLMEIKNSHISLPT